MNGTEVMQMPASNRPRKGYRGSGIRGIRDSIAKNAQKNLSRLRIQLANRQISKEEYFRRLHALKITMRQAKEEYS